MGMHCQIPANNINLCAILQTSAASAPTARDQQTAASAGVYQRTSIRRQLERWPRCCCCGGIQACCPVPEWARAFCSIDWLDKSTDRPSHVAQAPYPISLLATEGGPEEDMECAMPPPTSSTETTLSMKSPRTLRTHTTCCFARTRPRCTAALTDSASIASLFAPPIGAPSSGISPARTQPSFFCQLTILPPLHHCTHHCTATKMYPIERLWTSTWHQTMADTSTHTRCSISSNM